MWGVLQLSQHKISHTQILFQALLNSASSKIDHCGPWQGGQSHRKPRVGTNDGEVVSASRFLHQALSPTPLSRPSVSHAAVLCQEAWSGQARLCPTHGFAHALSKWHQTLNIKVMCRSGAFFFRPIPLSGRCHGDGTWSPHTLAQNFLAQSLLEDAAANKATPPPPLCRQDLDLFSSLWASRHTSLEKREYSNYSHEAVENRKGHREERTSPVSRDKKTHLARPLLWMPTTSASAKSKMRHHEAISWEFGAVGRVEKTNQEVIWGHILTAETRNFCPEFRI